MIKVIAVLSLLAAAVVCDLPVHCLKHQIVGQWKLYVQAPSMKGMGPLTCGHDTPDSDKTSYKAGQQDFRSNSEIDFVLQDDQSVKKVDDDSSTLGSWTMVYDEGFEIAHKSVKYFAFSKYEGQGGEAKSYCDQTLIGWYNDRNTNERGCYRAERKEKLSESQSLDQVSVVQPEYMNDEQLGLLSLIQVNDVAGPSREDKMSNQDHQQIIDTINQSNQKWQAKSYDHLVGKSFAQINKRAGRRKFQEASGSSFVQKKHKSDQQDLSGLPKELDLSEYILESRSQEECGSCYTIAAMAMLSSRLRKQGEDVTLSVQHSLNCNYYNQGCNGGYPFLVSKWAQEEYLIPEHSEPYTAVDGTCDSSKASKQSKVFGVKDYKYIGGSYGKGTEKDIMEELHKKGPVIMNFEPTFEFMYYSKGIFHSKDAAWVTEKTERPEWEKVDHSVLCYGWGEEDGQKYWLLQNSWGTDWGENGNFRVSRGGDDSAIESMAEAADPYVIDQTNTSKKSSNLISLSQQKQNLRKFE